MGFLVEWREAFEPTCRARYEFQLHVLAARGAPDASSKLPKIFHQQWSSVEEMPSYIRDWRARLLETFPSPEFQHLLWTDASQREFISKNYAWFLPTYDGYGASIRRHDAFRTFALHYYGGVYLDADYEVRTQFWESLPDDAPAATESPHPREFMQNVLMSSPARHPFWKVYWAVMQERARDLNVIAATGPGALDEAVRRYEGKFYVLPCANWNRAPRGRDLDHLRIATWVQAELALRLGLKKRCGSSLAEECLFGVHHGTFSWTK